MAAVQNASAITIKGSVDIVTEYFHYAINSILYQRGIYPAESFSREQKYGLTVLVTTDDELLTYLRAVMEQLKVWLLENRVSRLVVVIAKIDTKEVLERWDFNIQCEKNEGGQVISTGHKELKKIQEEIRDMIRQITASVTFLPLLEEACSFDLLIHTDRDLELPEKWGDNGPCLINQSEEVKLRSFSTSVHKVEAAVSYKLIE